VIPAISEDEVIGEGNPQGLAGGLQVSVPQVDENLGPEIARIPQESMRISMPRPSPRVEKDRSE